MRDDRVFAESVAGQVARALRRERARQALRTAMRRAARTAAAALRARYGDQVEVYAFGSAVDGLRLRLDSDLDLAVRRLPRGRYYEAWRVAESAARSQGASRLDLVTLEEAPDWLAEEILTRGERLA